MSSFLYFKRRVINALALALSCIAMLIGLAWLIWILSSLVYHGWQGLSVSVFTETTLAPGMSGGLSNAIVGSLLMVFFAMLLSAPVGLIIGTYLAEYGKNSRLAQFVRFVNDVLLSAPSIIIGLFVYQIYVLKVGHFSGWAGSIALSLLAIPIVTRITEDMFILVPNTLREASSALGAAKWKTIVLVVLRVSRTGVLTGLLLAVARIAGETAPLLFTALNNQFWSTNMNEPMANLPSVIFQYAMSPYEDWQQLAWTGALIITAFVLTLNIVVRIVCKQKAPIS